MPKAAMPVPAVGVFRHTRRVILVMNDPLMLVLWLLVCLIVSDSGSRTHPPRGSRPALFYADCSRRLWQEKNASVLKMNAPAPLKARRRCQNLCQVCSLGQ